MMNYNNPKDPWMHTGYDPYKDMNDDERMKAGCIQASIVIVMILVGLGICCLFGSCTTTKYVTVPEYHTDTLMVTKHQRDSIWMHDSIHVWEGSDTVRIEKWHTKYVLNEIHDTLYQSKTDSIPYPVEVPVEVPAELTWWQQTRLHIANVVLYILGLGALFMCVKRYFKP